MKKVKNKVGATMAHVKGYGKKKIEKNFSVTERKKAVGKFYKGPGAKYKSSADSFFKLFGH